MQSGFRTACIGFSLLVWGGLTACSESGSGPVDLLGLDSNASESRLSGAASSGPGSAGEIRVEARLDPVIAVDASGQARSEDKARTRDDRFVAKVEIAKADSAALGIDAGDGFAEEVVTLTVSRANVQVFVTNLRFTGESGDDIVFETEIRGAPAPELRAGDVGRVSVNGRPTLQGTFLRN
jgi:hypothetical protein